MIPALATLLAVVPLAVIPIQAEPMALHSCPAGAIGYVKVIKDGYLIAGGKGYYDHRTSAMTAWFSPNRSVAIVLLKLDMRPDATGHTQIHTEGKGSIRLHHGAFCAFDVLVIHRR